VQCGQAAPGLPLVDRRTTASQAAPVSQSMHGGQSQS
jgi:hypothetical protein